MGALAGPSFQYAVRILREPASAAQRIIHHQRELQRVNSDVDIGWLLVPVATVPYVVVTKQNEASLPPLQLLLLQQKKKKMHKYKEDKVQSVGSWRCYSASIFT